MTLKEQKRPSLYNIASNTIPHSFRILRRDEEMRRRQEEKDSMGATWFYHGMLRR